MLVELYRVCKNYFGEYSLNDRGAVSVVCIFFMRVNTTLASEEKLRQGVLNVCLVSVMEL